MSEQIETPVALDALPDRVIVRGDDGRPWHLIWHSDGANGPGTVAVWATEGRYTTFPSTAGGLLPATVLFRPDATTPTPAVTEQQWGVRYDDGSVNGPTSRQTADYLSSRDGRHFPIVSRVATFTKWAEVHP